MSDKIREALMGCIDTLEIYAENRSTGSVVDQVLESARAALTQQPESEPVAWAAFTTEGRIRIWAAHETKAHELAGAIGQDLLPLYLSATVKESLTAPSQDPAMRVVVGEDGNPKSITPEFGIAELEEGTHYLYAPSIAESE